MSQSEQGLCRSFLLEMGQGIHDLANDDIMLALYSASAVLDRNTSVYSTLNEIVGSGYTAGGKLLSVAAGYPLLGADGKALWDFDDVVWDPANWPGGTHYGLVYNASKDDRAIAVIDFASLQIPASRFTFHFPVPTDSTAFIRIGA